MASHSLQSLHHQHNLKSLYSDTSTITPTSSSLFSIKPTSNISSPTSSLSLSLSSTKVFSISPTTSSPSKSQTFSLDLLQQHLSDQNFRQADEETRRLLIVLAGEAAQKRGYVFFSEVQFISEGDLKAIDDLWKQHSNDRFGYSVQKRIWEQKANKDFTKFFLKVGWMKKLDTEIEQYNYRSFPNEFIWELSDDTPEGHLPLTNALRGTQLLSSILSHPAFDVEEAVEEEEEESKEEGKVEGFEGNKNGGLKGLIDGSKPLKKTLFKPDYSF